LSENLKKLNALTSLTLNFSECQKITDEAVLSLGDAVKGLGSLQALEVNFFNCKITDEGLNNLNDGLKKLSSLKSIKLNFNLSGVTSDGLSTLKQSVKLLPGVKQTEIFP